MSLSTRGEVGPDQTMTFFFTTHAGSGIAFPYEALVTFLKSGRGVSHGSVSIRRSEIIQDLQTARDLLNALPLDEKDKG